MSQQLLKAAAPVWKRMPFAASLTSNQVWNLSLKLVIVGCDHFPVSFSVLFQARSTAEVLYHKHQEDTKVALGDVAVSSAPQEAPRAQTVLKVDLIHVSLSKLACELAPS